jgi:hypothetical protein
MAATIVSTIVIKMAFQPSRRFALRNPSNTTMPERMPMRLITT